jgi:hypothetical protein
VRLGDEFQRVAPLAQDGYQGFEIVPITAP